MNPLKFRGFWENCKRSYRKYRIFSNLQNPAEISGKLKKIVIIIKDNVKKRGKS